MQVGVQHEPSGVEQFVSESVPVESFVLEQGRMKTDGDRPRVQPQSTTTDQLAAPFLKTGHAQSVIVYVEPFNGKPVSDPRAKNRFNVARKGSQDLDDDVLVNDWWRSGDGCVGKRTTLFLAHEPATWAPLQEASRQQRWLLTWPNRWQ